MTTKTAKKKKEDFYFFQKREEGFHVCKFTDTEGSVEKTAEHEIAFGRCDCRGFTFNGECRHTKMLLDPVEGEVITLSEARKVVRKLMEDFSSVYKNVDLPDEPYSRDADGNVTMITLNVSDSIQESEVLPSGSGAWEGCLREGGLKVRFVIN